MDSHELSAPHDEDPLPVIWTNDDETPFEDIRFKYESKPPPGKDLWDTEDMTLLDLAKCRAFVRVVELDPKMGTYRLRMKCLWFFRTLNSKEEAEIGLRGVPGVRMPGLIVTVEESRIWKDLTLADASPTTTKNTLCWRGITLLTLEGFKMFNMIDFPFDRHFLSLERMEFVWRVHKDEADYHKSMRLVNFEVHTSSMLPEWRTFRAYILPLNETPEDDGRTPGSSSAPTHASKFTVHLRLQRKHRFYSWQVFFVSYLITVLSIAPLGMSPDLEYLGERLSLYSGGMLTLVAFKYGVSDRLPCVPYQTFTDQFLLLGVLTIFAAAVATLYPIRAVSGEDWQEELLDVTENSVLGAVVLIWTAVLLYACFWKPWRRFNWRDIFIQDLEDLDPFGKDETYGNAFELEDRSNGSLRNRVTKSPVTTVTGTLEPQSPSKQSGEPPKGPASDWTVKEVAMFVSSLGLGHCLHHFKDNAVDGKMLVELSKKDIQEELCLRPLQARKLLSHLKQYRR